MSFSFPPNKISQDSFESNGPILTPEDLKARYLFGIKLIDPDGNEMPRETLEWAIKSAVSYLEHLLDIIIIQREFNEPYDYRQVDYTNFNFIQLKKRPACHITEIKAKFPNNVDLVKYPPEWYVLEKEGSQVQLSPVEGTFSGMIVTQGGAYVPLIYGTNDHWPHLFHIQYTAGFDKDCIPLVINDMIGMQAAIKIFDIMGDIIAGGPGIASTSVALDGASVSQGGTASAMYAGFSARIKSYKDQMDEMVDAVKKYYNGFVFTVA